MNTTHETPTEILSELASRHETWAAVLTAFGSSMPGVRLATTSQLNRDAGGLRKKISFTVDQSVVRVFEVLDLRHEVIFSRLGNHGLSIDESKPLVTGCMERSTFARLHADDTVIVVDLASEQGRALLSGQTELPAVERPLSSSEWRGEQSVRLGNALDVASYLRFASGPSN